MRVLTDEAVRYLILARDTGSVGYVREDRPYIEAGYLERAGHGVRLTETGRTALRVRGHR